MKVTTVFAETDKAAVEIEIDHRTFLVINVSTPPGERKYTWFKRRFQARIKRVGPRGGWGGEPKTIGYGVFDLRTGEEILEEEMRR